MPAKVAIGAGNATATKKLTASVGNADADVSLEPLGDLINLSAATSCSGLTLSAPICDSGSGASTVAVAAGGNKKCSLIATLDAAQIQTANPLSPQRCTVTLTATGPSDPEMTPLDASNNTTELVIDVLDKND